jgi:hypothetical protein
VISKPEAAIRIRRSVAAWPMHHSATLLHQTEEYGAIRPQIFLFLARMFVYSPVPSPVAASSGLRHGAFAVVPRTPSIVSFIAFSA